MKRIDTSQIISPTSRQPFTGRSLKFLQDALDEDKAGIIQALVYSNVGSYSLTIPYVISGCVVSDSNKDVTDGELFYGGKYYAVTGVNGTTNVAQFILTKTQDATADPLVFTDSVSKNVHDIYKYVATDAASGGDFDATDLVSVYGTGKIVVELANATQNTTSGTYVDMSTLDYTTTKTATYRVRLIANPTSGNSGTGTSLDIQTGSMFRIYNSTDSIVLDEKTIQSRIALAVSAGADLGVTTSQVVVCERVMSIASGKVIKAQFKTLNTNTTSVNNYLFIEEL